MSGQIPAGDVRITANINGDLHLKLKIRAAEQRTTVGELIERWIENDGGNMQPLKTGIDMNFKSKYEQASVMEITPDIAEYLLSTSVGNRKLRPWYVSLLAAAMRRGEWRVTSQGIGIDNTGSLRDAHHRLNACIESGVSFRSVVAVGLRPDAYEVTDIGIKRNTHDLLSVDKRVADIFRLATVYALGCAQPTADQMKPVINSGLGHAADGLILFCGATRRYYSCAPMKLAACVTLMSGGDSDYVLTQYRSLVSLDFDSMSGASKALVRQVDREKASALNTGETLARGFRVFDKKRSDVSRIQVGSDDVSAAMAHTRAVILKSMRNAAK